MHLFAARLDGLSVGHVDGGERARGERYQDAVVRHRFLAGRSWLRELAARRTGARQESLVARYECPACAAIDHGRPRYALDDGNAVLPLALSLSRSGGWAVAALAAAAGGGGTGHIGIDIEKIDRFEDNALDATAFAPAELREIRRLPATQQMSRRAALWSRKEAVLKAAGTGLLLDPAALDVRGPVVKVRSRNYAVEELPAKQMGVPGAFTVALARGQ